MLLNPLNPLYPLYLLYPLYRRVDPSPPTIPHELAQVQARATPYPHASFPTPPHAHASTISQIEERNEELHKLRKKNTSNVQVLTHIKEKLQFVAAENAVVRRRLAELDSELGRERDRLTKAKRDREVLRAENATMKQGQGFTNSDLLVVDFEQRKQQLQRMHETIADLRERYELLNSQVETAQARARESAASLGM